MEFVELMEFVEFVEFGALELATCLAFLRTG